MRSSDILVFTTTYNERANIGPLIDQIASHLPAADILVLDDNSPDGTWAIIQSKSAEYPQLRSVKRPAKLGIGSAHKYALVYAVREGYETLVTMDADFSHQPEMLPALLRAHDKNTFVTGSRYCAGGVSDYSGYRNVVSRTGNVVARAILGVKLKELTTYFRVFDVASLRRLPLRYVSAAGYSFGVQLVYYLDRAGVDLREVPIHFRDRTQGASKIPRLQILVSAIDLFKLALYRLGLGRDMTPDLSVEDECAYCGDRALAMTDRRQRATPPVGSRQEAERRDSGGGTNSLPVYVCLRCMREQVPNSVTAGTGEASGVTGRPSAT